MNANDLYRSQVVASKLLGSTDIYMAAGLPFESDASDPSLNHTLHSVKDQYLSH